MEHRAVFEKPCVEILDRVKAICLGKRQIVLSAEVQPFRKVNKVCGNVDFANIYYFAFD